MTVVVVFFIIGLFATLFILFLSNRLLDFVLEKLASIVASLAWNDGIFRIFRYLLGLVGFTMVI